MRKCGVCGSNAKFPAILRYGYSIAWDSKKTNSVESCFLQQQFIIWFIYKYLTIITFAIDNQS